MKSLMIAGAILGGLSAALVPAAAQNWTATSAPSTNWSCVASSADGSKLVAAVSGGLIYTSTNSGASWGATSAPATNWSSVASSADGTKLVAETEFALFTSSDSGANWMVAATNGGIGGYLPPVLSSADGSILTTWGAASGSVGFFISTNAGMAWTLVLTAPAAGSAPTGIACSANGRIVAQGWEATDVIPPLAWIQFSTDTAAGLGSDGYWDSPVFARFSILQFSADGTELLALVNNPDSPDCPGEFWHSLAPGVTGMSNCIPVSTWTALACSADATRLAAVAAGDAIYTSTNSGLTWAPATVPSGNWSSVASSADGTKVVAVVDGGGIYTWQTAPAPALAVSRSGRTLVISWTVPSASFVLQQSQELATSNWTAVPGTPVLDHSTLRNQVAIPAPQGAMFYRLASQ